MSHCYVHIIQACVDFFSLEGRKQSDGPDFSHSAIQKVVLVSYRLDQIQIVLRRHLQLNKTKTNKHPLPPSRNIKSDFSSQKLIYFHFSYPIYKAAGPEPSADFRTHATCPAVESEGWTEPENEARAESPPPSPDVKEPPQLPLNGTMGCDSYGPGDAGLWGHFLL